MYFLCRMWFLNTKLCKYRCRLPKYSTKPFKALSDIHRMCMRFLPLFGDFGTIFKINGYNKWRFWYHIYIKVLQNLLVIQMEFPCILQCGTLENSSCCKFFSCVNSELYFSCYPFNTKRSQPLKNDIQVC